jgi:hypothetical protein
MGEMMNQLNEQMAVLPQFIQYWMNWMLFIFLVSVAFVWKFKAARYVLITFILTMPVGMLVFYFTQNAHLLAIAHLILWTPLLFVLSNTKSSKITLVLPHPMEYGLVY